MKIGRIILVTIVLVSIFLTIKSHTRKEIVYPVEVDTSDYNRDKNSMHKRPFTVDKEEYPFESNWYEKDGVAMHYIDEGEGIPVLLCHGNPEWSFIYRNIIKEMKGEARLIAYDLPGFGFSGTPDNFNYSPQEYVEWIRAFVYDHLKLDKYIIVVQDWGGPTGLTVATNNPDDIYGVVLSNTWAWKVGGASWIFSNAMKLGYFENLVLKENYFANDLMVKTFSKDKQNNKAIVDAYLHPFPDAESRIPTAILPTQITRSKKMLKELETKLPTLSDKPIEMIFGTKDFALGNESVQEKWKTHFPNANVQLLLEASHFTQEESPQSFTIALRRILAEINY